MTSPNADELQPRLKPVITELLQSTGRDLEATGIEDLV